MIKVRPANINDLPLIVAIYNSIIPDRNVTADISPVTIDDKRDWFLSHTGNRPLWIIENMADDIIGWASMRNFYGRPAYTGTAEFSVYLDEKFRGMGYGKAIIGYAIEQSPALGISNLLAFVFEENSNSVALFKKMGFETWARLPEIAEYDDRKCSLLILGFKTSG